MKQVLGTQFDRKLLSAYPEAFVAPVSAISGDPVYSPQQDSFERFSLWKGDLRDMTPEVAARRLAALVENHDSLILFIRQDDMRSIVSNLPQHIAVRQLAFRPRGIVQDEANVSLLLQKAE